MPIRTNKNCQTISIRLLKLRDYIQANANRKNAVSRGGCPHPPAKMKKYPQFIGSIRANKLGVFIASA